MMKTYRLMYLPTNDKNKRDQMLKDIAKQFDSILTFPNIFTYVCTPKESKEFASHFSDENTEIHDNLKILYDVTTGFVCCVLKAYQSHKRVIMCFYQSQDKHIYLFKRDLKDIYLPIDFNSTDEPEEWRTLKYAQVYLKYHKLDEMSK